MNKNIYNNARTWQRDAFTKIECCNKNSNLEIIPVNACVGSGKTNVASFAFGNFIELNKDKKTIQMFICPRISLCGQQSEEIKQFIDENFDLKEGIDYDLVRRDCTQHDYVHGKDLTGKHIIFVVCDESLWGIDKNKKNSGDSEIRWHSWLGDFNKMLENGYVFGNFVMDEAHNYTKKIDKYVV